jgi:hypothetical protein
MVVDANGNTIARIGRWGNADSDAEGQIGIVGMRTLAVSDRALYIGDEGNVRILKAKLGYEAEEEATLP